VTQSTRRQQPSSDGACLSGMSKMGDEKTELYVPSPRLPPRKGLPPFEALRAFDAVAQLGGVRKAADYLYRDQTVISRHLRTVEDWVGAKLIVRTPSGSMLTEQGSQYHKQIAAAIDAIAAATADLVKHGDTGSLHIRCMAGFAMHWLSRRLGSFEESHPGFYTVHPAERSPDFLRFDADVEIRFVAGYNHESEPPEEFRSSQIVHSPVLAVASPEYLARCAPINEPHDLLQHQLLHEESFDRWRNWLGCYQVQDAAELTGPRLWQGHLTLHAACQGRGIALANYVIASEDLAAGRLVNIGAGKESFQPQAMGTYYFIAKANRWDSSLIRRFRDWLTDAVRADFPNLKTS
jgi:LysR family transcriptional regulator, glycine cleavage system transcriptional activator